MNAKNINILLRNNTGNKEKSSLIDGFVVRNKQFNTIFKEIHHSETDKPEQSYIIIGQRGSGKTTLLYRLKYAIEDDAELQNRLLPIMFSEEQYNLTELENLWENIAELLEDTHGWQGVKKEIDLNITQQFYEEKAFETLEDRIKKSGKKIIVFIENIDELFKKIGVEGQQRLREVLLSSNYIRIIASSTTYFDAITDYDKPFFDFFKIIELKGLSKSECISVLLKIADQHGEKERIESIIKANPSRVESLRRLTGGVPRTISYLFQIFLDNENGKAIKDLYQLIDNLTFLYKAELDQLSTQQQKVVDVIARNWDAIAVKEIAAKTRYESKQVSSILNTLERNQVIEIVSTKTKNNLYRIKERFLNIYYLMRFGKKQERENVIWLVRFYDAWCNKTELAQYIDAHLKNLSDGKYDIVAAIDMGNAFFSCENISPELKYDLFKKTQSILPKNFIKELKYSDNNLYERINLLIKQKEHSKAKELLNEIENRDEKYYMFSEWLYFRDNQFKESESDAEKLYALNPEGRTAFRIGYINELHLNDVYKAIKYYNIALDKNEFSAAERLGIIHLFNNDIEEAIRYFLIAVENGINTALIPISSAYLSQRNYNIAEKYIKMAIIKKIKGADICLGELYQERSQFAKAEEAFSRSFKSGNDEALISLGILQLLRRKYNPDKAKHYFEDAIKKGVNKGYYFLGKLYLDDLNDEVKGVENLNISIERGSEIAAHDLAHYYHHKKEFELSDQLFLKSFELGRKSSIFCLAILIFNSKRKDKKQFILDQFEEKLNELNIFGSVSILEYAFLLLWNGQIEKSISVVLEQFNLIREILQSNKEKKINDIIVGLGKFLNLLIAKGQYNAAYSLFKDDSLIDLKQIERPVYYALMNYMKNEYPLEYLKAGDELKEMIIEIIGDIEKYKKEYL